VGSEKMAVFDDLSEKKLFIYPHKIKWEKGRIPVAQKAEFYSIPFKMRAPLEEELLHFYQCVKSRQQPITDGLEGLRVLQILEKAQKSLEN
jgi:UDP-2-acetamido-3-amino-2,3-dideoxy-glucuronate N-acetyltransferase